jgi:hypothetical protein
MDRLKEDLVFNASAVLQFTEELLVLMRAACQKLAAGSRPVTKADIEQLVAKCDELVAVAKEGRAKHARWLQANLPPSPRVM